MSLAEDVTKAFESIEASNKPNGRVVTRRAFTCTVISSVLLFVLLILGGLYGSLLLDYVTGGKLLISDGSPLSNQTYSNRSASSTGPPVLLGLCPHILLFSAVRHGSTWFVDSVERCAYSRNASGDRTGSFGALNLFAELWIAAQKGPLMKIKTNRIPDYVANNHSVKVFPFIWSTRTNDIKFVLHQLSVRVPPVPIVLLTRNERSVYQSWLTAVETDVWNADTNRTGQAQQNTSASPNRRDDRSAREYYNKLRTYFADVRFYLDRQRMPYDEFDYDDIIQMSSIPLQNAACVIHNCNFAPLPHNHTDPPAT